MFAELFEKLRRHEDLSADEAFRAMGAIMDGEAQPAHIAGLLMALALKGEKPAEMAGFARAMRSRAVPLPTPVAGVFDTCGTGGDGANTFNVSTAVALVLAGCGVRVAKHGNRAASSHCGSADVFIALGVDVEAPAERVMHALAEAGIGFFFAPAWHPSMRHAGPTRRELGVRTAFNLLGPLTNPAGASRQLVGVSRPEHTELLARTLGDLGSDRAWVVYGAGGLDEISTLGHTKVSELRASTLNTFYVHPSDVDMPLASLQDLAGGSAADNAAMIEHILEGHSGPRTDIVLLNAAAALLVAGTASSLRAGVEQAAGSIRSGRAKASLETLRRNLPGMTSNLLAAMVESARRSAAERARYAAATIERTAADRSPRGDAFASGLTAPGIRVIAECKRRSPSRGVLRRDYDAASIAAGYERAGAAAISVLTEPSFFDGSLADLEAVRAAVALPILRKDFIVTDFQIVEARAAGADAVLLIVAALDDPALGRLVTSAAALGMAALVEAHDATETARAIDAGATIVGVNSRNLRTLEIDIRLFDELESAIPQGVIAVAESGLRTAADLSRLSRAGYDAFLIGERFMADADPGAALGGLKAEAERAREAAV